MNIPFICLSEKYMITDASPNMKSLSKLSSGKDFLTHLLGDKHTEKLEEFCIGEDAAAPVFMELPKMHNGIRFAVAVKCSSGGAILYLLKKKDEIMLAKSDHSVRSDDPLLKESDFIEQLTVTDTPSDISSFIKMCSRTLASLSASQILAGSNLREEYPPESILNNDVLPVSTSSLLFVTTALVCAISCISPNNIDIRMTSRGIAFEYPSLPRQA